MTDIVERLRSEADAHADGDWSDQVIRKHFTEAADEIEQLRAEVEAWCTAAKGAASQAILLREVILALDIRMVQPHMSGGGHFMGGGTLNAGQAEVILAATPKEDA